MTLQIIGSGFGRTGTMTMKDALGILGLGPTHHMSEIIADPSRFAPWKEYFEGREVDFETLFAGYRAQVDWPGAHVWQQSAIAFPKAKVIHTERPEEAWWASFSNTIGKFFQVADTMPLSPDFQEVFSIVKTGLIETTFKDFTDKDSAIAAYRRNNARVRELIPTARLLVFDVADGWEPLCDFLDLAVPDQPFPHHNIRREFWEQFGEEPADAAAA